MKDEILQSLLNRLDALNLSDTNAVLQFALDCSHIPIHKAMVQAANIDANVLCAIDEPMLHPQLLNDYIAQANTTGQEIFKEYVTLLTSVRSQLINADGMFQQLLFCLDNEINAAHVPYIEFKPTILSQLTRVEVGNSHQLFNLLKNLQQQRDQLSAFIDRLTQLQKTFPYLQIKYLLQNAEYSETSINKLMQINFICNQASMKPEPGMAFNLVRLKCFFTYLINGLLQTDLAEEDSSDSSDSEDDLPIIPIHMAHESPRQLLYKQRVSRQFQQHLNALHVQASALAANIQPDYVGILQFLLSAAPKIQEAYKSQWADLAEDLYYYASSADDTAKLTLARNLQALHSQESYYWHLVHLICAFISKIEAGRLRAMQENLLPFDEDLAEVLEALQKTITLLNSNKLPYDQKIPFVDLLLNLSDSLQDLSVGNSQIAARPQLNQAFATTLNALRFEVDTLGDNSKRRAGYAFIADMNVAFQREQNFCQKIHLLNLALTTQRVLQKPDKEVEHELITAAGSLKKRQYTQILLGSLEVLVGVSLLVGSIAGVVSTGGSSVLLAAAPCLLGLFSVYKGIKTINHGYKQTLQASASRLFAPEKTSHSEAVDLAADCMLPCFRAKA